MRKQLIREFIVNSTLMVIISVGWYLLGYSWIWIVAPIWIPILRDIQSIIHKKLQIKEDGPGYKS